MHPTINRPLPNAIRLWRFKLPALLTLAGLCAACAIRRETPAPPAGREGPAGAGGAVSDRELMQRFLAGKPLPTPAFTLADPGRDEPIDYAKYGRFHGVGTDQYEYEITDVAGLQRAVGEGIFPNEDGVIDDPAYTRLHSADRLDANHWDALSSSNLQAAFMIWAQCHEEPGVKAFFTASILERAGLIMHALKGYRAVMIHFPRSVCWSADSTFVWYVAPAALGNIQRLCREYPQLGLRLEGAKLSVRNGHDTDLDNDQVSVTPGRFVKQAPTDRLARLPRLDAMPYAQRRGTGRVQVVQYTNGHWQLRVNGRPFTVRGVSYGPTEVGFGPNNDPEFGHRWQFTDKNTNGLADAPYEAWVDADHNGIRGVNEIARGDFALLRDMGCNAIRWYIPNGASNTYDPLKVNKTLLRDLVNRYGIYVIAGDFLGAYTVGSGADWSRGTDYTDPAQRARMKEIVRQKVLDLRGEPWLLMWLLGNENNMSGGYNGVNATRTNAGSHPEDWARFVNEVAEMIHELDPDHPVAIGNQETGLAEVYNRCAPAIDVFGVNAYRGAGGFGGLWSEVREQFDRPVLITEYGTPACTAEKGLDEAAQAAYHEGCLRDITLNLAGGDGEGNCIGGIIFAYTDEWWKANDNPATQATPKAGHGAGHEEWFGITSQGSGKDSPFERTLRPAYDMYRQAWMKASDR